MSYNRKDLELYYQRLRQFILLILHELSNGTSFFNLVGKDCTFDIIEQVLPKGYTLNDMIAESYCSLEFEWKWSKEKEKVVPLPLIESLKMFPLKIFEPIIVTSDDIRKTIERTEYSDLIIRIEYLVKHKALLQTKEGLKEIDIFGICGFTSYYLAKEVHKIFIRYGLKITDSFLREFNRGLIDKDNEPYSPKKHGVYLCLKLYNAQHYYIGGSPYKNSPYLSYPLLIEIIKQCGWDSTNQAGTWNCFDITRMYMPDLLKRLKEERVIE